jgi:hypothetical protein
MATIAPHPRLKDVENAANFIALTADNFEVLAAELAKREPTYQNGSPTTVIGPPTSGARVLNEFWRDALGGEFRCTAAGTPGTRTQIRPAAVAADPTTGTIPVGYLILNTASAQLKQHQGAYVWNVAAGSAHTHQASDIADSTAAGRGLLTAVDAAAQRTALGLGDAATRNVGTSAGTVAAGDHSHAPQAASKRGCVLALCLAFTPAATGPDTAEIVVPYSPDDGTTPLTMAYLNTPAFDARYGEVRIGPVSHLRILDLGVGPPIWYGAGRSDTEGSPEPPSMSLAVRSALRSRANVKAAARSIRIDVKQAANLSPRPTLVIRRNPAVGLDEDVVATAATGTGWVTVTASFTAAADGAVWFELRNNLDGFFPCYFDNLVLA